ncbi:MAG: hypothetical protein ACFFD4_24400 [Candidatus Odinarchaeota archaeon]
MKRLKRDFPNIGIMERRDLLYEVDNRWKFLRKLFRRRQPLKPVLWAEYDEKEQTVRFTRVHGGEKITVKLDGDQAAVAITDLKRHDELCGIDEELLPEDEQLQYIDDLAAIYEKLNTYVPYRTTRSINSRFKRNRS